MPVDNSTKEDADDRLDLGLGLIEVPAPVDDRPRDDLWDTLEELFGKVAPKTVAHGKRNKAVADLRRLQADPLLIPRAVVRWRQQYPKAELTDMALATHYPQLTNGMHAPTAPCGECGMGGHLHVAGCSIAAREAAEAEAAAAGVLELPSRERFDCAQCGASTPSRELLEDHLYTVHGARSGTFEESEAA